MLVTGATSGIGWELACQLAEAGVGVIALGRNQERLRALAALHPSIESVAYDLADLAAVPALVEQVVMRRPDIGGIINNAGVQQQNRMDDCDYEAAHICDEVHINLTAPMLLVHALLPHLQRQSNAMVLNITSGLGYVPKNCAAVYSATKAGLHLFTQALRVQMRASSVRVVEAIVPLVDTPMTQGRGRAKLSPAVTAQRIIAGMRSGRPDIWVGKARALPVLQRWAPGLLQRVMQSS